MFVFCFVGGGVWGGIFFLFVFFFGVVGFVVVATPDFWPRRRVGLVGVLVGRKGGCGMD